MKLISCYLYENRKEVFTFCLFTGIFGVILALFQLPVAAVGYAASICIFLGILILWWDFREFRRKHRKLQTVLNEITVTPEHLPEPGSLLETDYQDMLLKLYKNRQEILDVKNGQFTDMMEYYTLWVHQIKTPIASLRLQLQEKDSDEYRQMMEEVQRIEQYVDMVLTYLRLDSDSTDYVIRRCDLDEVVKQALRKYASQFIRRKLQLNYEPLSCQVVTDEKWLLFVVEQVLSNALKYTRTGGISITMEEPKVLCIQDTGIGIVPADLPRIFEKGYTGYNGRNDKKASGIGLYLCRRICSSLGHGIRAESDGVHGTTVKIDLSSTELEVE